AAQDRGGRAEGLRAATLARGVAADLHGRRLLYAADLRRRDRVAAVPFARRGRGLLRGGEDARARRLRVFLGLGRDRAQILRVSCRRQQGAALDVPFRRDQVDV